MDTLLKEKVDLMIENYYKLKNNFKWEHTLIKHFSASVHATKKKIRRRICTGGYKKIY